MGVEAHYDSSVDVVSIRIRDGSAKYVIEGRGNFVIFADDNGVWCIDLEVKQWGEDYGKIAELFKKVFSNLK